MINYTTIYTVRHGETPYNKQKRYAGTIDVSLNEVGIEDCRKASRKIKGIKIDVVVTSTSKRAIETAKILLDEKVPFVKSSLCIERNYGKMQGLTADEVKSIKPPIMYIEVGGVNHSVNPPGGEPFELLRERAKKFHRFIFKNYKGSSILVISHGVFLQQFHGLIRGKSCIESLANEVPNLVLIRFRFNGYRLIEECSSNLSDRKQDSW